MPAPPHLRTAPPPSRPIHGAGLPRAAEFMPRFEPPDESDGSDYGLHLPHLSRQNPLPQVEPGQCELLMHGSPMLAPPLQVFTHVAPAPNAAMQTPTLAQGVLPQVTVDGHGHGPANEYARSLT